MNRKFAAVIAAIACGAVSVNVAQASAPSPRTPGALATAALSNVKTRCDTAVTGRVSALHSDITTINSSADLSSSDKSSLLATANSDITGLQALDATIQGDTTVQQARTDCQGIVNNYRVYVLFEPQMHLTISDDQISAAITKVQGLSSKLTSIVSKITDPTQQATAQAALTDFNNKLAAAQSAFGGLAGVLGLNPSGYPGNKTSLQSLRSALGNIRSDLQAARGDVQTIRTAVQSSGQSGTPSGSPSPSPTSA